LASRKDRIVLETDSPYLTPSPFRGQTNFPKYMDLIYKEAEKLTSITEEEIRKNIKELFNV
jgi:TatD DNase family protein